MLECGNMVPGQYDIRTNYFKTLLSWFEDLDLSISQRHNAIFKHVDILRVFMKMFEMNMPVESAVNQLRLENKKIRTPHPDIVMQKISSADPKDVLDWCDEMVIRSDLLAIDEGMLKGANTFALDETKVQYYGTGLEDNVRRGKPKDGTSKHFSFVTAHGVGKFNNITVCAEPHKKDEKWPILWLKCVKRLQK